MNSLRNASMRASSNKCATVVRPYGRTIVNGPLLQQTQRSRVHLLALKSSRPSISLYSTPLRSAFLPEEIRVSGSACSPRSFHYGATLGQENQAKDKAETKTDEPVGEQKAKKSSAKTEETEEEKPKEESEGKGEEEGESKDGKEKKDKKEKEAPPPPPPHGDKSPWQVFTETLQTEFKASKEWNESTKALSDGAHQFTESESVKKARQAYEATTGVVSSTTVNVLKTTAGAVGKGAAWTWETPVVKGVRTGVNATASVIEKGTRPIRETEAFKNVKNVIDDGSSSRYGGWVEKEERRKARELRELKEAGPGGKRSEVAQEDPE